MFFLTTLFSFFSIDLYNQRIKPFNESGKKTDLYCTCLAGLLYTHLNNQMINSSYANISNHSYQQRTSEQILKREVEKTCSLLIPTLTSVFLQKYSEIPLYIYIYVYIYTRTHTRTHTWTNLT